MVDEKLPIGAPEEPQSEETPVSNEELISSEKSPTEAPPEPSVEDVIPSQSEPIPEQSVEEIPEESTSSDIASVDFELLDIEGRWLMKVLSGPNTGAEFAIHGGSSYLIGTDAQACDIVFQDLSVSRKHARLTVDTKDTAILEDLQSRNGTFVDGEKIDKKSLSGNVLVSMGTTTFMLIDREAERTTIVAGTGIERREEKAAVQPSAEGEKAAKPGLGPIQEAVLAPLQSEVDRVKEEERLQSKLSHAVSSLVILAVVTGLIMTIGIGGALLFRTEEVIAPTVTNPEVDISKALSSFPAIRYSYNPTNKRLLLVGHVLTTTDRSKMLDVLQQLKFIRNIDYNNVVIDELVWREINQVLAKNPAWRGITITSPTAGRYILSGFLRTRAEAEELFDYISQNFAYVDLLERRVVVEEELLGQINRELVESGFRGVSASISGGDLMLKGNIGIGTRERFQKLITLFRSLPGIRSVEVTVSEAGQKEAVIDLTSKYRVTGFSKEGKKVSVVINGRILQSGDSLDDMFITEISPTTIYLEKGDARYKIDFNR
jgi:type III secretion system YscD/HrpQ family protein